MTSPAIVIETYCDKQYFCFILKFIYFVYKIYEEIL